MCLANRVKITYSLSTSIFLLNTMSVLLILQLAWVILL